MKRSVIGIAAVGMLILGACGSSKSASTATTGAAVETSAPSTETSAPSTETSAPSTETSAPAATGGNIQKSGECGMGTGQKASGDPIKLGGIVTNVPGIDFTWISSMAKAYFDCVNDNGGINGRPIQYIVEEEQIDPQQIAALATKLIEQEKVVGLVGNTSIIDCSVNGDYYKTQGFFPIIAGVDHACFNNPNFSAVNMGPYYSSLGGAQAAVRAGAKGKLVITTGKQPGVDLINSGVVDFAKTQGMEAQSVVPEVPIADPAGLAQQLVADAGKGGGVVLDFTGPTVLPLLQAIEQQGLIDEVIWASSTPPNDPSIAAALGKAWNGKFLINAEFNLLDSGKPDQNHMNAVREKYSPSVQSSSFAQMGYLAGRVATDALLSITGDITKESVNAAFKAVKNFKSDILCKPWYYDSTVGKNISNNVDYTVVPQDGKMVLKEDCFEIAEFATNPLKEIRAKEKELGLNAG